MACGSPAPAQLFQNRRRWAEMTGLSRLPRRRQRFVECATLVVGEVIAFVIGHQVDNCPLAEGGLLVENEPRILHTCWETAHVPTVRVSRMPGKRSGSLTESVDLAEPPTDLVPTGGN
jgi:hypothetical protein